MSEQLFDPRPFTYIDDPASPCTDCGVATTPRDGGRWEYFMVHDSIWRAAGMKPRGDLCIGCLERRLGRQLVPQDFTDAEVNEPFVLDSPRLRSRKEDR
jgi:hypothetical protein